MNKYLKGALLLVLFTPVFASAYFTGVKGIIVSIGDIVRLLTTLVGALALLVFFWGLFKFILTTSATGKADGRKFMTWGIVALFVMVSVWGIVGFMQSELGLRVTVDDANSGSQPLNSGSPCSNFDPDGGGPCDI